MAVARRDYSNNNLAVAFAGLPERDRDQLSCIHSVQIKKLRQWSEQLNILNISQAVPDLCHVLRELMELDVVVDDVFDLYMSLRPTVLRVQDSAANLYHQKRLQLTSEARQALELAHRLDSAVIALLKALLADLAQVRVGARVRQMTSLLGSHIFVHFGEMCLRLNEFCLDMPKGFWRECHSVYWFLREAGCHNVEHEQVELSLYPKVLNAEIIYKGLVLYSIMEPSRYDRVLQPALFEFMLMSGQWVDLLPKPRPALVYGIVLTEDLSHVTAKAIVAENSKNLESVMFLNTLEFASRLKVSQQSSVPLSENPRLNLLMSQFLEIISSDRFRQQQRTSLGIDIESYFGFSQIYQVMSSSGVSAKKSSVAEEIDYGSSVTGALRPESLILRDQSVGGFCLETKTKHKMLYDPGDLVLFYFNERPTLNVIRWKRMKPSGESLIGVECLGAEIMPVDFAIQDSESAGGFEKGIVFVLDEVKILLSRTALLEEQLLLVQNSGDSVRYRVAEVSWLVSGYVQSVLEPLR